MKKGSLLFVFILLLSSFAASIGFAQESGKDKLFVAALGDSITFGYNLQEDKTKPSSQAFPYLINEGNAEVANISFPGWTSLQLLGALSNQETLLALQQADVITLNIGSNDYLQAIGLQELIENQTPIEFTPELQQKIAAASAQLSQNLQNILQTIRQNNQTAPVVFYNMYNPFGASEDPFLLSLHQAGEQITLTVNQQVLNPIAAASGSLLVDTYSAFSGNQAAYIIPGDIHPNAAGHQVLGALADQALASLVPAAPTVEIVFSTTEKTEGPVKVTVTADQDVLEMKWLPGEQTADKFSAAGNVINGNTFDVPENGTYTVYVKTQEQLEAVKTFKIENILSKEEEEPPAEEEPPVEEPPAEEPPAQEEPPKEEEPAEEQPVTEQPQEETPVNETEKDEKTPVTEESATPVVTVKKNELPDTATATYNYTAAGAVMIMIGAGTMLFSRRRARVN
ncbi:GDSL-type esterase/lipase family protein [Metabacillus indicus]|uniref:GDSL-type esterase/lipase family protein n=1 Tax=Metabacillus indicus TaxID=246786 RepID=UPI000493A58F|nr:GDSL-type esterase/lipase family protein [Metabacillus indicus]KEZ48344.1 hypothetical protein AZ46_0215525 [Metabacillus indicus LMG 22858]